MGENEKRAFQLSFNPSIRVAFQGSRVTSDGGLLLLRELDERLGLGEFAAECLTDARAKNAQLPLRIMLINEIKKIKRDPNKYFHLDFYSLGRKREQGKFDVVTEQ